MKTVYHVIATVPTVLEEQPSVFIGLFDNTTILETGVRAWLKSQLKPKENHINNGEIVPEISAGHFLDNVIIRDYPVALAIYQPNISTWTFKNWIVRVESIVVISTSQDVANYISGQSALDK